MILDEYVSFETAKLLKKKGFCQDYNLYPVYWMNGEHPILSFEGDDFPYSQNEACAPSQQAAMRLLGVRIYSHPMKKQPKQRLDIA